MYLAYTPEQEALRKELRGYFAELMTPEVVDGLARGDLSTDLYKGLVRRLGADGWLGLSWPKEYGGQGRPLTDHYIFFDESQRAGVPVPFLTTNTIGPTIMAYGSDEQKQRFLPQILKGELHFSIGYSEPGAGTDLAGLKTRATRDGDHYVVNGQKMWTSLIHHADYVWLACRTAPDAPKHKGLSILIVPTDSPGFSWQPVPTLGGGYTSATFYDDVRVPASNIVLGENEGWRLITSQLNHERVALSSAGVIERKLIDVRRWSQQTTLPDGRRVIDQEWVQLNLAKVHANFEFLRLQNWKVAFDAESGVLNVEDASTTKVFGTETNLDNIRLLMEVVGQNAYVKRGSPESVLMSRLEASYRSLVILTFGGGVNEVQRDLITVFGLGMPMVKR